MIVASLTETVVIKEPVSDEPPPPGIRLVYVVPSAFVKVCSLLPVSKDDVIKNEPVSSSGKLVNALPSPLKKEAVKEPVISNESTIEPVPSTK